LRAAEQANRVANLKCVTFSGTLCWRGRPAEGVGKNIDWRALTPWRTTRHDELGCEGHGEEFDRKPGLNPASWKHGAGWKGGTPLQQNAHQKFVVNGNYAWHVDGPNGRPVASPPDDAERWQFDLWLNPHGFLKAARMPGANPKRSGGGNWANWAATAPLRCRRS